MRKNRELRAYKTAVKLLIDVIADMSTELDAYREYYLAWEENGNFCDTVGVPKEDWDANQKRLSAAEAAVKEIEKNR